MHFRTTFFLLVLAIILAALIAFFELGKREENREERERARPMLIDLAPESVIYWSFYREGLFIECVNERGQWMITKPVQARADNIKINYMLSILAKLPLGESVTAAQRQMRGLALEDYGLARPAARMVFGDAERRHLLGVGGFSPLQDAVYVQLDNQGAVIATSTNLLELIPHAVADLRDLRILPGAPAFVRSLEIKRAGGPFISIAREGSEWIMRKPVLARADWFKVSALLEQLFNLQVHRFVADSVPDLNVYGLSEDEVALQIAVWQNVGQDCIRLLFSGRFDEKGECRYAACRGSEAVYAVRKERVDELRLSVGDLRDSRLYFMASDAVAAIRIEEGEKVLQLRKSGAQWMIAEPRQWPADNHAVEGLIGRLNSLRIEAFVEETNAALTGLDLPARILRMAAADPAASGVTQKVVESVSAVSAPAGRTLALSAPQKGKQHLYARFEDEAQVYQLSAAATIALDPLFYRDMQVLTLDPQAIIKIIRRQSASEHVLAREGAGPWNCPAPGAKSVNLPAVEALLQCVAALRAVRFEKSERAELGVYGLKAPRLALTFILGGQEGIQKTLLIGDAAEDGGVYAMIQGQDVVFVIEKKIADELEKNLML